MSTRAKDSRPRRLKLPKLSVRGQADRGRLPTDAVVAVWRNNNLQHLQEVRLRMRQLERLNRLTDKRRHERLGSHLFERYRANVQRRDSIYGIERNFVCSWRSPKSRSQVIDLSLSALIS
jgi:hypothetical protein